jgi:hypothetical protein
MSLAEVTRGRMRRMRRTSVSTARPAPDEDAEKGLLRTNWSDETLVIQVSNRIDDRRDSPGCPPGRRGQWSTCSSMPSHLIDSALRECQMDRWRKPSPSDAIHFENGRLGQLVDPLKGFSMMTKMMMVGAGGRSTGTHRGSVSGSGSGHPLHQVQCKL